MTNSSEVPAILAPERITVRFGLMAPPLREQIPGLVDSDHFQKDADALTRLWVRGLIYDSDHRRCSAKLLRKMEAAMGVTRQRRRTKGGTAVTPPQAERAVPNVA